jgi:Ca2+/Na+ antiporter
MAPAIAQFVLAAAVIGFAGTFLTRSADTIAEQTGWGRLLVGGVFLAGATSLPELTVGISAIRQAFTCLATVLITAIVVMGQLYQAERRIFFVEPDAMLIILLVLAALTIIFWLR